MRFGFAARAPGSEASRRRDDARETACAEELRETVWKEVVSSVESLRVKRPCPTSCTLLPLPPGVLAPAPESDW